MQKHKNLNILYIAPTESKITGVADYSMKFREAIEEYCIKNLEVTITMENPFQFQIHNSILDLLRIRKDVYSLKKHYNLIHAEMSSSSWAEFWYLYFCMKRFRELPVILTVHDSPYLCLNPFHIFFFKNYRNYFIFKSIRKILDILVGYILESKIIKRANFIFITTRVGLEKFKQRFKINYVNYLPHLCFYSNQDDRNYSIEQNLKKYILYFGFVRESKGIDVLIEAFYRLLSKNYKLKSNVALILCGGYENKDRYFHQIREKILKLNLSSNIEITGYVENEYLINLLRDAICVVFPYSSKKTYSSSGALIRALELGSPIITSNIPTLTEYVKDGYNGLIFKEGNSEDLYFKLTMVINDSQLRRKLSRNAREYVKSEHNNRLIAEKVIKKYMEVLGV